MLLRTCDICGVVLKLQNKKIEYFSMEDLLQEVNSKMAPGNEMQMVDTLDYHFHVKSDLCEECKSKLDRLFKLFYKKRLEEVDAMELLYGTREDT